ncbi:MAG: ABC transporter transmembrane domain-containing protein, partial [Armatimonadetes bacterium]|nr:ABC transporter transmembrane domain-containing protein [Armatimonadota bacterium]
MHTLPDEIKEGIKHLIKGDEIALTVESDLGPDGTMGAQWLVSTKEKVYVISPDSGKIGVLKDINVKDIVGVKAEALVGNGCLIANVKGDYVPVIRYSNAMSKEFGHAARRLEALAKGEEPPKPTEDDVTRRCPKCAFPLETGSQVCPNCVNRARAMRRLLGYVQPYKTLTIIAASLMVGAQLMSLAPPYLTKVLVDNVFRRAEPFKGHVPPALRADLLHLLGLIVLALIVTRVVAMVMGIFQSRITAYLGSKMIHDIRMELYSALERLTVAFFDKRQTGAVISRVSQDTGALQEFLAFDIQYIASNTLTLIFVLAIMFQQNWKLAALTILPAPFASLAAMLIFTRLRWVFRRVWHRWSKLHSVMSDSLQGLRVVKAFAQEDKEVSRFERRSRNLYTASMQAEQTWATLLPVLWFVLTSGQFIVWYAGGIGVIDVGVTTGTLIMFVGYIGMLYGPLQIVTRMWDWIGRCLAASERVFEIMDSQREESDPEHQVRLPNIEGRIKFDKVTFGYDKNHPVLNEIELEVQPGEMIGLVGHSGAGKSTMINLLARFYVAQEGVVEIDGKDIRHIHLEDLRRQIGIVPQESYLFSGTIMDNIAYSKPNATPEEIIRAAKAANAHDFIVNFPDGYETQVGERGQSLSGGERQRIAIARAILHDPKILIMDEATSSVDTATEKQIQEALARL